MRRLEPLVTAFLQRLRTRSCECTIQPQVWQQRLNTSYSFCILYGMYSLKEYNPRKQEKLKNIFNMIFLTSSHFFTCICVYLYLCVLYFYVRVYLYLCVFVFVHRCVFAHPANCGFAGFSCTTYHPPLSRLVMICQTEQDLAKISPVKYKTTHQR